MQNIVNRDNSSNNPTETNPGYNWDGKTHTMGDTIMRGVCFSFCFVVTGLSLAAMIYVIAA